jgi:hypothetical protein
VEEPCAGKTRAAIGLAASVLVVGVGGAAAIAPPAAGSGPVHVRKFIAKPTGCFYAVGPHTHAASEVERHHHRVIGSDSFSSTFIGRHAHTRNYVAVAWKAGALTFQYNQSETSRTARGTITGGTGKYKGVSGTVRVRFITTHKTAYTLRFTL